MTQAPGKMLKSPRDWNDWKKDFISKANTLELDKFVLREEELIEKPILPIPPRPPGDRTARTNPDSPAMRDYNVLYSAYKLDSDFYEKMFKVYAIQVKNVGLLCDYMRATVSEGYRSTCFTESGNPQEWYMKLKETAEATEELKRTDLLATYDQMMKPLKAFPKDPEKFIGDWERLMEKSKQKGMSFAQNLYKWTPCFLDIMKGVAPF